MQKMGLAARRGGRRVPKPVSSPTGGPVIEMNLNDSMRAAHVMVCGDAGVGKPLRVRQIAEESLASGRTVIYLSNNGMCHGLASAFAIARFSVSSHGLDLTAEDGERFARHVMTSRTSVALNLRALERRDLTSFLAGLMGALNRSEDADVDVFFECLDDMIKRKRHSDRDATNELHSMLLRGPKATGGNGVRVVMGATSPNEVPIEAGNTSLTLIGTRTAGDPNMQAMSNYAGGNPRLYRCSAVYSASIAAVDDRHQWLWPKSEGIRAPHMPYYCPLHPLVSDAGGDGPFGLHDTSEIESGFVEAIVLLRNGDEDGDRDNAPAARRATRQRGSATVARRPRSRISVRKNATRSPQKLIHNRREVQKLRATGLNYYLERNKIAKTAWSLENGLDPAAFRRYDETIISSIMAREEIGSAASWMNHARHGTGKGAMKGIVSDRLLAIALIEARRENAEEADRFFDLLVTGDGSQLKAIFADIEEEPMLSALRLDAIRSAWANRATSRPTAANDDIAIAKAI